jgi:hypothetical protein
LSASKPLGLELLLLSPTRIGAVLELEWGERRGKRFGEDGGDLAMGDCSEKLDNSIDTDDDWPAANESDAADITEYDGSIASTENASVTWISLM